MTERFKVLVLKTNVLNKYHGFESHFVLKMIRLLLKFFKYAWNLLISLPITIIKFLFKLFSFGIFIYSLVAEDFYTFPNFMDNLEKYLKIFEDLYFDKSSQSPKFWTVVTQDLDGTTYTDIFPINPPFYPNPYATPTILGQFLEKYEEKFSYFFLEYFLNFWIYITDTFLWIPIFIFIYLIKNIRRPAHINILGVGLILIYINGMLHLASFFYLTQVF